MFVFGCGRCDLHGGNPEEMYNSLKNLKTNLRQNTIIMPGHNYSIKRQSTIGEEITGNPFFSFNGGHSLCTLDFMWGHVRLSETEFERYLIQFRPKENKVAMKFYRNNLNRMTLKKLNTASYRFILFRF